jgi:hypothetical protein
MHFVHVAQSKIVHLAVGDGTRTLCGLPVVRILAPRAWRHRDRCFECMTRA